MDVPTAAMVREWATNNEGDGFDFARYGYPEPEGTGTDHLGRIVARAVGDVEVATARTLNESLTNPGLVALAQDAVLMRVQQILITRGTTKAVRDALTFAGQKSMRAGDYSRTNRDPGDARKAMQINPWGDLSDTLLALATPERRAELLAELGGKPRPLAISVSPPVADAGVGYEL